MFSNRFFLVVIVDVQEAGRRVLEPFHGGLIEYLYNRLFAMRSLSPSQARKALVSTASSEQLQQEFRLLGYLATPPTPPGELMETDNFGLEQVSLARPTI